MELRLELSIEQQFNLAAMNREIDEMSAEELRATLRDLLHQMAIKDSIVRQLLRRV